MEVLSIVLALMIGGLAGWAATRLFKTDKQNGILMYVVLGMLGAVVGRLLLEAIGLEIVGSGVLIDFVVAFVGAAVIVGLSKFIAGRLAG